MLLTIVLPICFKVLPSKWIPLQIQITLGSHQEAETMLGGYLLLVIGIMMMFVWWLAAAYGSNVLRDVRTQSESDKMASETRPGNEFFQFL